MKIILDNLLLELSSVAKETIDTQRNPKKLVKCLACLSELFKQFGIMPQETVGDVLELLFPLLECIFNLFQNGMENRGKSKLYFF